MTLTSSVHGETHRLTVADAQKGWRLDHFLSRALTELSRSRLQAMIADGGVDRAGTEGAAGKKTIRDANHRVKPGETYEVRVPPPAPATPEPQNIPLTVVHEDADLIVIDKPAGLVVHPAAGNLDGTLVNALLAHIPDLPGINGVARPGIVHRIDKDTSGLLVVAKNERAMKSLAKQFAAHTIERAYNAVVWGAPRAGEGLIEGNLGRNPFDRKRMAVLRGEGKAARTRYRVIERFASSGRTATPVASLIECRLETGRTHQIRVHLTHLGHPLIGDATYGRARQAPKPRNDAEAKAFELAAHFPRQALHAGILGFQHPSTHKTMRFESPWPADFAALVNALRALGNS